MPIPLSPSALGLPPFRQRWPWWGADLQTVRDTLWPARLPPDRSEPLTIDIGGGDTLLALLDLPGAVPGPAGPGGRRGLRGLVLVLPGLGGSARAQGPRRLAVALQTAGFATLRLNLRGAGEGRSLAGGSYAARCNQDLLPVLRRARRLADELAAAAPGSGPVPLAAAGISLGGTMLLNACQEPSPGEGPWLDGLVCVSSPLDLPRCTEQFEWPRNALYQRWLVRRLRAQVLADRRGLSEVERTALCGPARPRTIRSFDERITAPRWGYASAAEYYRAASPLPALRRRLPGLPRTLLLHAADDPWVPAAPALELARDLALARQGRPGAAADPVPAELEVLVTERGGHCGFHGAGDDRLASWADRLCAAWLGRCLGEPGAPRLSG